MRKQLNAVAGGILGGLALLAANALPASAATSGDTATTFSLTGGSLDVAVAADAALTSGASGAASVSGTLGDVSVTDARGGTAGWTASAAVTTPFAHTGGGTTASGVSYNAGAVTETGDVTATSAGATALTGAAAAVVSATAVTGNNSGSWNPTLTVALPSNALAGDYTGTITTSVV
jgi:hypothetical protein